MNRHQVLTGAANSIDNSVSIGSVENYNFTAYGSGGNLVILASSFERVQVISSSKFSNSILRCIDCTVDTGKIAAAYGNKVHIFEPTPSAKKATHNISYKWIHVGSIEIESDVVCVSWNNDSNRLLIGCTSGSIQIWSYNPNSVLPFMNNNQNLKDSSKTSFTNNNEQVKFSVFDDTDTQFSTNKESDSIDTSSSAMIKRIWYKKLANPVKCLKYSPDGSLFASFSENDRLVKIWHEIKTTSQLIQNDQINNSIRNLEYDFIYLAHPRAVTSISWRQISKFMPKGMVSNSLITSCKDNICRIWSETVIPDTGLLHANSQDESTYISITKSPPHKRKILNKLHKMRLPLSLTEKSEKTIKRAFNTLSISRPNQFAKSSVNLLSANSSEANNTLGVINRSNLAVSNSPNIHNSQSCHELNYKHNFHSNIVNFSNQLNGFYFHLAGFIDPDAGIPMHLIPNLKQSKDVNFVVHWMNNKDFQFTYAAELFSKEIFDKQQKLSSLGNVNQGGSLKSSNENVYKMQQDLDDTDSTGNVKNPLYSKSNSIENLEMPAPIDSIKVDLNKVSEEQKLGILIDKKLDQMVKDWYTTHDILFCIHPIDGSILIWLVDWLDEYMPGSYRQAQVSFHAKLPNSIPVGDAVSLTNSVFLYTEPMKSIISRRNDLHNDFLSQDQFNTNFDTDKSEQDNYDFIFLPGVVNMVSKHNNGTLNLWKLQFQENSHYQSLVNVSHLSRICGHRFRVNNITSHPVLPFLLTNSINDLNMNLDKDDSKRKSVHHSHHLHGNFSSIKESELENCDLLETFQKGVIIWGVESVGPLSKSGGIYELARIDSSKPNEFENIAWFPCFLPSSTLGTSSSSPSTLFASTNSSFITIYQAVFDARTLLQDIHNQSDQVDNKPKKRTKEDFVLKREISNTYSSLSSISTDIPFDSFNVVSIQSTARPGCIIELEQIADSLGSWTKSDLFHVYQEGLIANVNEEAQQQKQHHSKKSSKLNQFNESYFLVLLEKRRDPSSKVPIETVHMWKITIQSNPNMFMETHEQMAPTSSSFSAKLMPQESISSENGIDFHKNRLTITSCRVCKQDLPLPNDVYVVCADSAAADLSSSAMFAINKVPYLFSTACSDGIVRFWSCKEKSEQSSESDQFEFVEWELMSSPLIPAPTLSEVKIENFPLAISCSYNSRFAIAYKNSSSRRKISDTTDSYANLCVKIYECESTGGSEWKLEDLVHIKNVVLPEIDSGINFDYIFGNQKPIKPARSIHSFKNVFSSSMNLAGSQSNLSQISQNNADLHIDSDITPEIPSSAAKISIKRQFSHNNKGNRPQFGMNYSENAVKSDDCSNQTKSIIKLDWASTENGSHILTIAVGNKILVYSCVVKSFMNSGNNHIKQINSPSQPAIPSMYSREKLESKTIKEEDEDDNGVEKNEIDSNESLVKWVLFRSFELDSADDMQALPTQIKWVREGLLIVGLNSEMQVYSQWSSLTHSSTNNSSSRQSIVNFDDFTDSSKKSDKDSSSNKASLIIPKNHSVLDLNKLHRLTKEPNKLGNMPIKDKNENESRDELDSNATRDLRERGSIPNTRIFDENQILEIIQDRGLFMQAKHAWPVLPQYHPKQLLELMNSGKINRVKAILMHLTRCIIDSELKNKSTVNVQKKLKRKMSVCSESEIPEEQVLNYLQVDAIPPLPLFALFAADNDTTVDSDQPASAKNPDKNKKEFDLFDSGPSKKDDEEDEDELKLSINNTFDTLDDEKFENQRKQILLEKKLQKEKLEFKRALLNNSSTSPSNFNSNVCKLLNEYLTGVQLNGLNSIDQMYLVALADTVANVKCDVIFSKEDLFSKKEYLQSKSAIPSLDDISISPTVDNCGLKFLLALRSYNYLMRTLPLANREKLKEIGLGTANYAWAFHSECEQELLNAIPNYLAPDAANVNSGFSIGNENVSKSASYLSWADLKQYGVGWWLKNSTLLRQLIERVAKCSFQIKNDPLDAALFYLAMKKKGVLWGLFKTVKDTKMTEFFKNDFNDQKYQSIALKNAFVLLGKQRFEHAAAFFLLSGRLKDAIEVCIRNLKDIQLALVIIRLYESDFDQQSVHLRYILCVEVLGYSTLPSSASVNKPTCSFGTLSSTPDKRNISKDPFLRSMALWFVKDYKQALSTLFETDTSMNSNHLLDSQSSVTTHYSSFTNSRDSMISHVFNFYTFLKHHPLVLRQHLVQEKTQTDINTLIQRGKDYQESANVALNQPSIQIQPIERRLHFIAGYYHLVNGCPLLTLDVLSKLPKYTIAVAPQAQAEEPKSNEIKSTDRAEDLFASAPPPKVEKADEFDWSTSLGTNFGKRFEDEELELKFDSSSEEDEPKMEDFKKEEPKIEASKIPEKVDEPDSKNRIVETFAQQIKFISCLKILIEEMSTLATGFEVVGGQLRYFMYYWLERETQVLRDLGDYKQDSNNDDILKNAGLRELSFENFDNNYGSNNDDGALELSQSQSASLLHEQVLNDQKIFQAKVQRLNRRKEWLRTNELLLRTFLSYCSLHSASGAGLNSVKMELVLLMQELAEDRSMKQLLLPVPVPTTIPLLSASIASSKNVVAGPIQMLKSITNDILNTIASIYKVPTIFDYSVLISTVKEASVSLSSCIYQCLCDSDAFIVSENNIMAGMQAFSRNILYKSTYLMTGMRKNSAKSVSAPPNEKVITSPRNWPGVSNLAKLLEREQDTEAPKLKILLFESLVAVYSSLLINAFVFYDSSTLWRLLNQQWNEQMWNRLFGGGGQTEYRYKTSISTISLDDESTKQRIKMNSKLGHRINFAAQPSRTGQSFGTSPSSQGEERVYKREFFVAPEISMINYFLNKPEKEESFLENEDYDSDDETFESHKRDVLDDDPEIIHGKRYSEHVNPKSYSWCLMRYAIIKYSIFNITSFLSIIGIETQELPVQSPLIHQVLKTCERWMDLLLNELNSFPGPPDDYIPGCNLSNAPGTTNSYSFNGPKILKYQSMLDPANTPFIKDKSTYAVRRLWHFLVTKKCLHDLFIRYIFKKKPTNLNGQSDNVNSYLNANDNLNTTKKSESNVLINPNNSDLYAQANSNVNLSSSYKIVHKDQEAIHSFCLNERDKNMLALCTNKEIIEMDMRNLLTKNPQIDDECEMDILALQSTRSTCEQDVYVIGNMDLANSGYSTSNTNSYNTNPNDQIKSGPGFRSNSLSNVTLKRNLKEVRRLASHPTLPYYLSGTNDSIIKLWHWGTTDPLSTVKQSEKSTSAKITKLQFNTHGNKFGVSDMDGYLHLYQLLGCSFKPYLTLRCHKVINDFLFFDSSSLILTIGTYNDSYVVSLWDTLLPSNKSLIKTYREPDIPSGTCAAYSSLNHLAYCGNRKGEVIIYDVRTHKKLTKFVAHESSVKTIALDPNEYYIATGSSEGNVKLWNLKTLEVAQIYHHEHSKSSLIRSFNSGVNQLYFTNDNQLLSCGADGTLVIRNLKA